MRIPVIAAAVAATLAVSLLSTPAQAAVFTVPFGHEYTAGDVPAGPGPWVTATFDDHGGTGSVTLTVRANLVGANEFVTNLLFNLDPSMDPTALVFSAPTKAGTFAAPVIETGSNGFSAGGGSRFDVRLQFDNSPPINRFGGTESVSYTVSGPAGLRAQSFAYYSTGGGLTALPGSAHVQGVGTNAQGSGWVTVPEPSSLAVIGLASAGLLARRRRRA